VHVTCVGSHAKDDEETQSIQKKMLMQRWSKIRVENFIEKMREDDTRVTNDSDKHQQLDSLNRLSDTMKVFRRRSARRARKRRSGATNCRAQKERCRMVSVLHLLTFSTMSTVRLGVQSVLNEDPLQAQVTCHRHTAALERFINEDRFHPSSRNGYPCIVRCEVQNRYKPHCLHPRSVEYTLKCPHPHPACTKDAPQEKFGCLIAPLFTVDSTDSHPSDRSHDRAQAHLCFSTGCTINPQAVSNKDILKQQAIHLHPTPVEETQRYRFECLVVSE